MHSIWVIPHTWWVGFRKKICKPIQICHDSYYTSYSTSFTTQIHHLSRMCAEARCEERKTENQELWNRRHKTLEGQIKASQTRSLARKFRPRQIPLTSVCGLAEPIQQQLIFLSVPSHIHLGVKSVSQHISRFLKRAESRTNGNNVFSLPLQTPRQLTAVPCSYLAPLVTLQFSPQKDGREGEVFSIQRSNKKKVKKVKSKKKSKKKQKKTGGGEALLEGCVQVQGKFKGIASSFSQLLQLCAKWKGLTPRGLGFFAQGTFSNS